MVLQPFHLGAEHVRKGGAEHAAEGHQFFGKTTDPEINRFDPTQGRGSIGASGGEEGHSIDLPEGGLIEQGLGRRAPGRICGGGDDGGMGAVGRDEIDQRSCIAKVQSKVVPADVRPQGGIDGIGKKEPTGLVEAWDAILATAGDVKGRQVERQSHQVIAQGFGDKLVNLLTNLVGSTIENRADGVFDRCATGSKGGGIEKSLDEAHWR